MKQKISYPEVKKLWTQEFPMLKQYTPSSFMMKADIMLIGLSFSRRWESYDIALTILPLWYDDSDEMKRHTVRIYLYGLLRKFHFDFDYHFFEFEKLKAAVHELVDPLFQKEIQLNSLFDIIKNKWSRDIICDYRNLIFNKSTFELLLAIALFFKDTELKALIEKELEKNISNCSDDRFEYFFDKSRGAWLSEMEERFGDRDKFMAKVRANSALPKVVKLNEAHLVPVPAGELELQLHLRLREKWEIARFRFRNWRYRKMKI